MASNNTQQNSWADQWDSQTTYSYTTFSNSGSSSSSKFGGKLDKAKAAASTGVKKVKTGTAAGFQWMKTKYYKATHKK